MQSPLLNTFSRLNYAGHISPSHPSPRNGGDLWKFLSPGLTLIFVYLPHLINTKQVHTDGEFNECLNWGCSQLTEFLFVLGNELTFTGTLFKMSGWRMAFISVTPALNTNIGSHLSSRGRISLTELFRFYWEIGCWFQMQCKYCRCSKYHRLEYCSRWQSLCWRN